MYNKVSCDTLEELYSYITDEEILHYYFGAFEEDAWYISPFRHETKPSFTISYYKRKWVWRDFGLSKDPKSGIQFVMELFSINFYYAIKKIYKDLILDKGLENNSSNNTNTNSKRLKPKLKIPKEVKVKIWQPKFDSTIDYWDNYNFSYEELLEYNIYEGEIWFKGKLVLCSSMYSIFSIYMFNKKLKTWKGYNPYPRGKQFKFFSNNISDHVQNYDHMLMNSTNKEEYLTTVLIITKSYKDCKVLNKLGYLAIAPHAESMFIAPWDVSYLKQIFKYIYVFYDNDTTGVTKCTQFTKTHGLSYFNIPLNFMGNPKIKDGSDVVDKRNTGNNNEGYDILNNLLLDKFKKDGIQF